MHTQTNQPFAQSIASAQSLVHDESELLSLASNPAIRYKQQAHLAANGSLTVKCALASNPLLLPSIQRIFAEGNIPELREALAANPKLDPACQPLLRIFSSELKPRRLLTLIPLASNPALTEEMLNQLAHLVDIEVIAALARNPSLPESIMIPLSNCNLREITIGLACNPGLPEHLQAKLIASGDAELMENIARNPGLTVTQQEMLALKGSNAIHLALLGNAALDGKINEQLKASLANNVK
ncbi:hypothetical protein [Sideroxydans sp.]